MKIIFYISGYDGCGYYRVQMVAKYLNKLPNVFAKISTTYSNEEIAWADIVVLQKQCNQQALTFVDYAKKLGKKIISECDDDYFSIPFWNPAYKAYVDKKQDLINFYTRADAITVTTSYLSKQLDGFAKTYVLPNSLDFKFLDTFKNLSEEQLNKYTKFLSCDHKKITREYVSEYVKDKTVIGWGGSPTHLRDLEQVEKALLKICSEYKDVVIMMIGCTTETLLKEIAKRKSLQLILVEPIPVFGYPQSLKSLPWDIGICPIEDNIFNRSKSNLKFLEFTSSGFPCVCSNVENYANTVQNGITGMLVDNNETAWYTAIKYLIDNKEERKRMAETGYNFVRDNFNIEKNINLWINAYTEILKEGSL